MLFAAGYEVYLYTRRPDEGQVTVELIKAGANTAISH
jgi:hypothetical protein